MTPGGAGFMKGSRVLSYSVLAKPGLRLEAEVVGMGQGGAEMARALPALCLTSLSLWCRVTVVKL